MASFYNFSSVFAALVLGHAVGTASAAMPDPQMALQEALAQRNSATAVLQQQCPIAIQVVLLHDTPPTDLHLRERLLALHASLPLPLRHVRLMCGSSIRSEAWNAYVPDRLTPRAQQRLSDHHTPFGRAVGEKNFWRERLKNEHTAPPDGFILENQAILHRRSDNQPIALVIERYTKDALPPSQRASLH